MALTPGGPRVVAIWPLGLRCQRCEGELYEVWHLVTAQGTLVLKRDRFCDCPETPALASPPEAP
jgi:hypothetical protein